MSYPTAALKIPQESICVLCKRPWGEHAARGEWCPTGFSSGPIFSTTGRFTPLDWLTKDGTTRVEMFRFIEMVAAGNTEFNVLEAKAKDLIERLTRTPQVAP